MYVFLALLQQMGLDGCLARPASGAANTLPAYVAYAPDKKTVLTGAPRGPFWAVGVRIERASGRRPALRPVARAAFPATLNQLKANPDSHKAWFEDRAAVSGMTAGDAKAAAVFLAVPVNSLSPRMATPGEEAQGSRGRESGDQAE